MRKLKFAAAVLLSLAFFGFAGCAGGETSDTGGDTTPPAGDEEWQGNWERPDYVPDDPGQPEVHLCEAACYTCGKCLTDCEEPECAEKCFELGDRTEYVFNGTDSHVNRKGGVTIENDHLGNINLNASAEVTWHITAAETTTVCIGASVSEMSETNYITSDTPITINGEEFYSRGYLEGGSTNWTNFYTVWLGCVTLNEGDNVIVLHSQSANTAYNFKEFIFRSPVELTWTEIEEHVCTSQNEDGKCTDYDCNELACLDKDETGWKSVTVRGGDEKVLKYYIDNAGVEHSLWNEGEQVIGNIANSLVTGVYGQTIILSFEATEETYLRFSLNMSTTSGGVGFTEMFDITLNGQPVSTGGVSGTAQPSGWSVFAEGTVAYVKVQAGLNTIMLVHKDTNAGDNIKDFTLAWKNGEITLVQAVKPD